MWIRCGSPIKQYMQVSLVSTTLVNVMNDNNYKIGIKKK